jgi:anti-anti-sigma factor
MQAKRAPWSCNQEASVQQELVASWVSIEGIPYVTAEGELTIATAPLFDEALCEARNDDPFTVVVSLEKCAYCDSTGLGVLLRHAKQTPHFVVVSSWNSVVRRFLHVTRADAMFDVVADLDEIKLYLPADHQTNSLDHALEVG